MTALGTAVTTIQTGVYTALSSNSPFASSLTGIFDDASVPENQPFPYLVLGGTLETPQDALGTVCARGYDDIFTIHGWSRARGYKQLQAILGGMNRILHRQPLVLSGQFHVGTWYLSANFLQDPDGLSQHLVARYHIFTQENL